MGALLISTTSHHLLLPLPMPLLLLLLWRIRLLLPVLLPVAIDGLVKLI